MNLIDGYRYLVALQQHRHFGRAAVACHITQPALSNALRALESHFGTAIVRRGRQYEGLTPEGELVLASAHRVLSEQESLLQELASGAGRPSGRLLIGAVPTALPIASRFAVRLLERHPGLRPELRSLSSQDIERGLDTLAIDMALGYTDRLDAAGTLRLRHLPLYVEHYYLLRRSLPVPDAVTAWPVLRFGPTMDWAEAATLPLALLSPEMHNRAIVDGVFHSLGLQIRPVFETNAITALLAVLQAGGLAAVLPGALVSMVTAQPGLEARPLRSPHLLTPIGFMTGPAAPARALRAALEMAASAEWLAEARAHSGPLGPVII